MVPYIQHLMRQQVHFVVYPELQVICNLPKIRGGETCITARCRQETNNMCGQLIALSDTKLVLHVFVSSRICGPLSMCLKSTHTEHLLLHVDMKAREYNTYTTGYLKLHHHIATRRKHVLVVVANSKCPKRSLREGNRQERSKNTIQ